MYVVTHYHVATQPAQSFSQTGLPTARSNIRSSETNAFPAGTTAGEFMCILWIAGNDPASRQVTNSQASFGCQCGSLTFIIGHGFLDKLKHVPPLQCPKAKECRNSRNARVLSMVPQARLLDQPAPTASTSAIKRRRSLAVRKLASKEFRANWWISSWVKPRARCATRKFSFT